MLGKWLDKTLLGLVIAYIAFNCWTFYEMFSPADCDDAQTCIFPDWSTTDTFSATFNFFDGHGRLMSDVYTLNGVNLREEHESTHYVKVPPSIFQNGTTGCAVKFRTSKKVVVFSKEFLVGAYRQPKAKAFNLIGSKDNITTSDDQFQPTTHWLSALQISILKDRVSFPLRALPHELLAHVHIVQTADQRYLSYPIFHINPLLQSTSDWIELPKTPTDGLNLTLKIIPTSIGKLRLRCMLEQATEQLRQMGFKEKDLEDILLLFTDTNLYLLLTTVVVSVFHIFFDFLAFKNDIQFWRNADNTAGISLRTIIWRCLSTTIVFIYLYDEGSSLLIVVPAGISMVIEFWKLLRMTKISISLRGGISVGSRNREEQETDQLDAQFMNRLMLLMVPLCICGAIYSLIYTPHRSWRSWILQTAVNGVYAFGFLLMTPQLFINYRLKSVANLPWRALTYKAFNTFIDDFFAFIIKMPTAHRIACFRDDIIFVIYMYQRRLYPVDHTRVNEFGQRGDAVDSAEAPAGPVQPQSQEDPVTSYQTTPKSIIPGKTSNTSSSSISNKQKTA